MTHLPRPLLLCLVIGLSVLYVQTWRFTLITNTDFPVFYSVGRLLKRGENPYSLDLGCAEQSKIRPDLCMPYGHTPVLLPLFAVVSSDDYVASYRRWSVVLVGILAMCIFVAYKLTGSIDAPASMAFFLPIFLSITQGNVSLFILLAVMLWTWLLLRQRDLWAGLALSIAVIKPQFALLLGLPLLFVRPKSFLGFVAGASFFFVMGLLLVGLNGYRSLAESVLVLANGFTPGNDPAKMYSVTGLLTRLGFNRLWAWPVFILTGVGIALLWRSGITLKRILIAVILTTFATPYLYGHDLSLLALPLIFVHPLAPILATCLLLLTQAAGWQFAGVYLLMGYLLTFYMTRADRDVVVIRFPVV